MTLFRSNYKPSASMKAAWSLVGFSQGTMMALHIGLRRALAPAAIVGFPGALALSDKLNETKVRPPILPHSWRFRPDDFRQCHH